MAKSVPVGGLRRSYASQTTIAAEEQEPPAAGSMLELAAHTAAALFVELPGLVPVHRQEGNRVASKVTVVGVGSVGMACAQTILTQHLVDEIALVDVLADKLRGEMLDLQHAAAFLPTVKICANVDYAVSAGSDLCIITAGARQREGESRLSLVERNVKIFKSIIPQLLKHSPNTILLVISNPVDILTWLAWKLSGLPANRVFGSGTNLDSSRFRFLLADQLGVHAQNVHAYILGEHGDSSVPLWSGISVAGIPLMKLLDEHGIPYTEDSLKDVHKRVVDGAYEVIKLKGYTSWAIGYSVAGLVHSLLRNQRRIHPVSVFAQGLHGIDQEVFLSLPSMIGRGGVVATVNSMLTNHEQKLLQGSAQAIWDVQSKLDI